MLSLTSWALSLLSMVARPFLVLVFFLPFGFPLQCYFGHSYLICREQGPSRDTILQLRSRWNLDGAATLFLRVNRLNGSTDFEICPHTGGPSLSFLDLEQSGDLTLVLLQSSSPLLLAVYSHRDKGFLDTDALIEFAKETDGRTANGLTHALRQLPYRYPQRGFVLRGDTWRE